MGRYLWKVTAKRIINGLPQGANVEIATTSRSSKPSGRDIAEAMEQKYGDCRISSGNCSQSNFDFEQLG